MKDEQTGCLGHWISTPDYREFDCDYEFAFMGCEDCIFGNCGGVIDPRVDPDKEENINENS